MDGMASGQRFDVAIVGSGIVGLGHAVAAVRRGCSVVVIDRSPEIIGASVRNFGHLCLTGQDGQARELGERSREIWLELAELAGFWIGRSGTVVVARADDELELLAEFRDTRSAAEVELLTAGELGERVPVADSIALGGAWLPRDLQVDPRAAARAIRAWLSSRGVEFRLATNVVGVESGLVHTAWGEVRAETVVVAVNYDVDGLFPELAGRAGILRCGLDMMLVDADLRFRLAAPLFTGWSLVRYAGFAGTASAARVRERLAAESPDLAALDVNQMYTQRPDGTLIVGDTHYRGTSVSPFQEEDAFASLLELTRELFGLRRSALRVRQRWQGVYASAPEDFLVAEPADGVRVVSVTTGIGMTTGLALGEHVIAGLHAPQPVGAL